MTLTGTILVKTGGSTVHVPEIRGDFRDVVNSDNESRGRTVRGPQVRKHIKEGILTSILDNQRRLVTLYPFYYPTGREFNIIYRFHSHTVRAPT